MLIPAGARNIKITENTENYLALKDLDGKIDFQENFSIQIHHFRVFFVPFIDIYYINGKLNINSDMNKYVDRTLVNYQRDGKNETMNMKGPITLDLFVMVITFVINSFCF